MHGIMKRIIDYSFSFWYYIFMYEKALEILKIFYNNHYDAYIVGGFVRDKLLNIESGDIDICTNAKPDIIKELFNVLKENYGSCIVEYDSYNYEITTFRKELYNNSRFPKVEFIDSLEEDLKRRDFTINTICIDKDEKIIDLYNGIKDLNDKILKSIGNPDIKLKEDPLRIIRAKRFKEKYNLKYDKELEKAVKNNESLIKTISKKRIEKELNK